MLHKEEARLFGIAAGDQSGGQGVFLLNVVQSTEKAEQAFKEMTGAQLYLLGQGLGSFKGGNHTTRSAVIGGTFSVRLIFRPNTHEDDRKSIADALYLFGLLGSLGSRARHGMGSVALTSWSGDSRTVPQDKAAFKAALLAYWTQLPASIPPFTAFSQKSRVDVSAVGNDPLRLLTTVGSEQQMYRSYGQNGKVAGKQAERNFAGDHDLIMDATNGKQIKDPPRRVAFGLPHNYFFSSTKAKADVNYAPQGKDGRRASPLLLHIHQFASSGESIAVHTLLPAMFLPPNANIRIKARGNLNVPANVDWQVLHNYLDRFSGKEKLHG